MVNKLFYTSWAIIAFIAISLFSLHGDSRATTMHENYAAIESDYLTRFSETDKDKSLANFLPQIFNNRTNRYFIRYPANWQSGEINKSTVILTGKEGTLAYLSNINIQTLRTKKIGGLYQNVSEVTTHIKKQIEGTYSNVRYVDQGETTLQQLNGTTLTGQYLLFTYSRGGLAFKQWQVIIERSDGYVFYVFAYNSPLVQYQKNLVTVEAILKSWDIY